MNARTVVTDDELAQAQREAGWTDHRTRIAGLLFNSGLSASQVACLIGGVTRNAVIGKVHRASLADEGRTLHRFSNGAAKGVREKPMRPVRISIVPRLKRGEPPPHIDDAAIPAEQWRSLIELSDACCHWPVGDPGQPGFFFCGAVVRQTDAARPDPYCASHMRRAHDPARGMRRPAASQGGAIDHAWR